MFNVKVIWFIVLLAVMLVIAVPSGAETSDEVTPEWCSDGYTCAPTEVIKAFVAAEREAAGRIGFAAAVDAFIRQCRVGDVRVLSLRDRYNNEHRVMCKTLEEGSDA